MIKCCGDTLFNNLRVENAASARCALTALLLSLTVPDPVLSRKAVRKLSLSPYFSILIASGRLHCRDYFDHVRALFLELRPLAGSFDQYHSVRRHLISAFESQHPPVLGFLAPHLGFLVLFASAADLPAYSATPRDDYVMFALNVAYRQMFRRYLSSPSLLCGYFITTYCPRFIAGPGDYSNTFDRDLLIRCLSAFEQSADDCCSFKMAILEDPPGSGIGAVSLFPDVMILDEAIRRFASCPVAIDDSVLPDLLQTALRWPCLTARIVDILIENLVLGRIAQAIVLINQVMRRFRDAHLLFRAQRRLTDVCGAIVPLLFDLQNKEHFQTVWFFFLSLFRFSLVLGSPTLNAEIAAFAERAPQPLRDFLLAELSGEIPGKARHSFATFWEIPTPLERCTELLQIIDTTPIDALMHSTFLDDCPYLWPSVLMYVITTQNKAVGVLLNKRPPDHRLINTLFYHASICVSNRTDRWYSILSKPDVRMFRKFPPQALSDIHFILASDLGLLVKVYPLANKTLCRIVFSWRAWVGSFGLEEFVKTLLGVLIWNIQISTDPLSALNFFRSAAALVSVVCEKDLEATKRVIAVATHLLEGEDCGPSVNGDGLAEFCLVLTASLRPHCQETFDCLLDFRKRLINDMPQSGSAKLGFCVALIKGALYRTDLRGRIKPEVFGEAIMKHEWQAAIDYFIADQ
jgi:hypothetical protein